MDAAPSAPEMVASDAFRPIEERRRIVSLDVLRGFSILGILFVNMQLFAMPMMDGLMPSLSLSRAPVAEQLAWTLVHVLCTYKFLSLFAVMFGAGLVVQMKRAEARGGGFVPMYLRRLAVLALIGLAHAVLLWYGDILFIYAITGLLALPLRKLSIKTLLIVGGALVAFSILLSGTCMSVQMATGDVEAVASQSVPTGDQAPQTAFGHMKAGNFQPFAEVWQQGETRAYRDGPFLDALAYRLVSFLFVLVAFVFGYGWRVWGLFVLGAALMKARIFEPEGRGWQRRFLVFGVGFGLPLELVSVGINWSQGFQHGWWQSAAQVLHEIGSVGMCLGYLGGVCLLAHSGVLAGVSRALANVGRMALTTYLGETLIATFLTYWWGLGWFGSVDRVQQLGLTVAIYAVLVLFSAVWLRWCIVGPVEWIWRTLSYLRIQPLLRK